MNAWCRNIWEGEMSWSVLHFPREQSSFLKAALYLPATPFDPRCVSLAAGQDSCRALAGPLTPDTFLPLNINSYFCQQRMRDTYDFGSIIPELLTLLYCSISHLF
jgi:hypothetical protein